MRFIHALTKSDVHAEDEKSDSEPSPQPWKRVCRPPAWFSNRITGGAAAGEKVWGYSYLWRGTRLAICAWKEPDGGSDGANQLICIYRRIWIYLGWTLLSATEKLHSPTRGVYHCADPTCLCSLGFSCGTLHQSSVLACRVKAGQQFTERSNNL